MKCSFHDDSQMTLELDSFLKFEHNIGNIIFFEDVKSFIVLDPKWLMDIFRCFVSHQYDDDTIGMPEWSELEQTGKLADKLIEKLLEKVPDLSTPELKKFVLQIMEKFDIIVRPINYEAKNDFYMPCMIKAEPFHNIIGGSESENERKTSWFCLKFNFLPPSYFNHILVSFVKRKELFVEKNRRLRIYRNIGEFQLNKSDGMYNRERIDLETLMETSEYRCKEHHDTMHSSRAIYVRKCKRRITLSFTPYDMCYDVDSQRIYCIDREHSKLICIDRDGTNIFTITDQRLTYLKFLTIDNKGSVLVLCRKDWDILGCVIEVDYSGKSIQVVITDIYCPTQFCFNRLTNSVGIAVHGEIYIYKGKT
ncbi:unnamed protein product [Mytilus edulis]|uniref:C-terminal of Roc (COR) domain-containing protein n=1 Tax=Mytilus edulis TaxID=6550 RepID=A0A8S3UQU9_MYTED|nr:unnamed protein product [Mytilus edulis]